MLVCKTRKEAREEIVSLVQGDYASVMQYVSLIDVKSSPIDHHINHRVRYVKHVIQGMLITLSEAKSDPPIQANEERKKGVEEGRSWRNGGNDGDDADDNALVALAAAQIAMGNPVTKKCG